MTMSRKASWFWIQLYAGHRENVLAEIGEHLSIYPGKYLVALVGEPDFDAEFDAEGVNNKRELELLIAEYRRAYPNIQVVRL